MSSAYATLLKPYSMREPAWRFNLALAFAVAPQLNESLGFEDRYLNHAIQFYRRWSDKVSNKMASREYPSIFEATQIHLNSRPTGGYRWLLEAALMTSATDEEIADLFSFRYGADTIRAFRRIYFDIDPYRDKKACVVANVLSTSLSNMRGSEDYDYTWKMMCYDNGWEGLLALIDYQAGSPFTKKFQKYFRDMSTSRISYNSYHISVLKQSHRESAMRTIETAQTLWHTESKTQVDKGSEELQEAAKQILESCRDAITAPTLEDFIQSNVEGWEGLRNVEYPEIPTENTVSGEKE
jgi:hypothetical protein